MPGINDGAHLGKKHRGSAGVLSQVMTLSIVPVGLTNHRQGLPRLTPVDADYARKVIAHVSAIQERIRESHGTPFCFLGDEFFIMASQAIPPRSHYGDFPLVENGVGMVRTFLDEFHREMGKRVGAGGGADSRHGCDGRIFHPILKDCVERMNAFLGTELRCELVENRYFGGGITVAAC